MKLLDDIIELLTNKECSLEAALTKGLVLAHRLGDQQLREWLLAELTGYPDEEGVPPYRHFETVLMGTLTNGAHTLAHQRLSTINVPENFLHVGAQQSIVALEHMEKQGEMAFPVPVELYGLLSEGYSGNYRVQSAARRVPMGALKEIVVRVRAKFLDKVLELSARLPPDPKDDDLKDVGRSMQFGEMMKNAQFGDNNTFNIGIGNVITDIVNQVVKGNFDALAKALQRNKVAASDIADLKQAIDADQQAGEVAQSDLGPKVKAWMAGMLLKAGTTAWEVSVQTGATLIAALLAKYYGL